MGSKMVREVPVSAENTTFDRLKQATAGFQASKKSVLMTHESSASHNTLVILIASRNRVSITRIDSAPASY